MLESYKQLYALLTQRQRRDFYILRVLMVLTHYVLAGLKLVPKVQQSYLAITKMRSALPIIRSLREALAETSASSYDVTPATKSVRPKIDVSLVDVTYRYPAATSDVLRKVNLRIPIGSVVGLTGSSGGGKSTLLEILMCLLKPDTGYLNIDTRIVSAA